MKLPPPGSDSLSIAQYVDSVWIEAAQDARRMVWATEAERGLNLWLGNHFQTEAPADSIRIVINRVSNAILAQLAVQAGDLPKITHKGRESGEPALYFLNTLLPEGQALAAAIAAESQGLGEPWDASQPLTDEVVTSLKAQIAQAQTLKTVAMAQGMPAPVAGLDGAPLLTDAILVEVSDSTTAAAMGTVFDGIFEEIDGHFTFMENVLNKNIMGMQPTLVEWDDELKLPILTNVHVSQCFFDPTRSDLRRSQYALLDDPMSNEEAKATFPQIPAEEIDSWFSQGQIRFPGGGVYTPAASLLQTFWRDMGIVRHAWFRYQPYPLTAEEAEAAGKIESRDVETGEMSPRTDEIGQPMMDEMGQPAMQAITRQGYFHPDGDELLETITDEEGKSKPNPRWPVRYGIRQILIVANTVVDDRECEWPEIPLPTNINVPVPYSPYGQGEGVRLDGLQMALNYVVSAIVTHQRYSAYPPEVLAASIAEAMGAQGKTMRTAPGQRILVPDALLANVGHDIRKVIMSVDTPPMGPDVWRLVQFLVEMIDKEGNASDVMNGNASASWSGEAIASLQNAAASVIRAKSMHTETYLRRLVRLIDHAITHRMEARDWQKYLGGIPWQAIQAMKNRDKSLYKDITVEIASGSGANKAGQTQSLVAAKQAGMPISDVTMMERLGLDADGELTKQTDYDRKRAAMAPQQQMVQAAGAPGQPAAAAPE